MTDVRLYGSLPAAEQPASVERASRSDPQAAAAYMAEFLGTFVLVFTVGCCLLAPGNPVWNATAIGCVLMVMIYATGPISGGNLNPAVSLALALVGALEWRRALGYCAMQLLGGVSAGFCCSALFAPRAVEVEPGPGFTRGYAMGAEAIYTCVLCFVVCSCAASKRNNPKDDQNQFYALAIGFAAVAAGYAIGTISGACVNPAVAIGLDVSALSLMTGLGWLWACAELLGALLAAALFREVRPEDFRPQALLATYEPALRTKCLSEFLGAFVLVFTFGVNLTGSSPAPAWSTAAALMCMTYSLADVSGGHFNPAVTLAVVLCGRNRCSAHEGLAYACAQLAAGVCAGFCYELFHAKGYHRTIDYGLRAGDGYGREAAAMAEMFFTFVLAYVVLACSTTSVKPQRSSKARRNAYFAFAIGACIAAGGFGVGAVSGGEFNPAVCLGVAAASSAQPSPSSSPTPLTTGLVFSSSELLGGLLAAVVFGRTHPQEFETAPVLPG